MRVVILGIQGSGKSTQADCVAHHFSIPVLSTGNILRAAIDSGDEEVCQLYPKKDLDAGKMAPTKLVNKLVIKELINSPSYIIEGYPRTADQAQFLIDQVDIDIVIELTLSEETAKNRLISRSRSDDNGSGIAKRFAIYNSNILDIRAIFKQQKIFYSVDSSKTEIEITRSIISLLEELNNE